MEIYGSKVEIINEEMGTAEASVRHSSAMSLAKTEQAISSLSTIVALAFEHHDQPVELSYVAITDVKL